MKKLLALALCALLLVSLAACTRAPAADPQPESVVTESEPVQQPEPAPEEADVQTADPLTPEAKGATAITEQINAEVYQLLDFSDEQEGEFAARGFMTAPDSLTITGAAGNTVWSQDAYDFARDAEAPPPPTPASGATRSTTPATACSRSRTISTRCAATTSRTSPSSAATTAGSSSTA